MAKAQEKIIFTQQIKDTRKKIQESFERSHEALRVRETSLLSHVAEIETEFNKTKQEMNKLREALDSVKSDATGTLINIRENFNSTIEMKNAEILDQSIDFVWDPLFENDIKQIGSIKLYGQPAASLNRNFPPQVKPIIPNYKTKQASTAYSCKTTTAQKAPGELNSPANLAIHYKTERIYIADQEHHRVQVFNCNGDYLFMFSDHMKSPKGICISLNQVFVTQFSGHCIYVYGLEGRVMKIFGTEGSGKGQFKSPHGIDVSENNQNIYVCDYSNDRVQIFTEDLDFHSMLGVGVFKSPRDVKITRDKVLVLDESDPCLFVFSSEHLLTNRIITRGTGKQTSNPYCFDIDREYSIIMSDFSNHCVYVFSHKGQQIHKIGKSGQEIGEFTSPYGIALDNMGRIIVVCRKSKASLQMF